MFFQVLMLMLKSVLVNRLDYPIRKLYGEPMLPIYDYNTDSQIENSFGINFDTEANIYNFRYFKALYNGS